MKKWILYSFSALVFLSLLTPFWVFSHLQFPYVTSKAFYFRIAMELALPLYLYLIVAYQELRPNLKNWLNISVLAFLVVAIISSFTGVNVARSLWGNFERMGGAYYIAHLVLLYFYIQLLGQAGNNYLKRFLQAFILVAVVVTLNGLSGKIGGPMLTMDPSLPDRVSSTFGNPIFFASYLVIPMFLSLYFAVLEEKLGWRITYGLAAFLQLLGIYFSGTRGAVVGLIIGVFLAAVTYVALTKERRVRKYGLVAIILVVLLGVGLYSLRHKFVPGTTLARLTNLNDTNTQARLVQWGIALKGFKDHPVLGVGPENYYVIADTYYNPLMYKYDPSWFDKPHNYLIEVLVTTGVLGFLAYLAMFVFSLYAFWKAYKADLLGLLEMCLLVAALITYQAQNFTVFDTVSASIAFFGFTGLAAFLSVASSENPKASAAWENLNVGSWILAISGIAMLYLLYLTNVQSIEAAKRTNFGYAYTSYDPHTAADYFQSALAVPFNLDPRETANRYSDFADALVKNSEEETKEPQFVADQLDKATANQQKVADQTKNDPLVWLRLSIDKMNQAIVHNTDTTAAEAVINQTIAIAPKRVEMLQLKMQLYGYKKDWADAIGVAQQIASLNPYNPQYKWQLAEAYDLNGQITQAVHAGDEAVAAGYKFSQIQEFVWYIQYYENQKNYAKVAPLLEQAVALQPSDANLYKDLAGVYANLGNYDQARLLAQQVEQMDPSQKAALDQFIKSLPSQ